MTPVFLTFVLVLSIFLGFELISKVPSTLHTPLMSGSDAISGITLVGAIASLQSGQSTLGVILGTAAVTLATINVVGGYDRYHSGWPRPAGLCAGGCRIRGIDLFAVARGGRFDPNFRADNQNQNSWRNRDHDGRLRGTPPPFPR